jgi:hypothetical protein
MSLVSKSDSKLRQIKIETIFNFYFLIELFNLQIVISYFQFVLLGNY